MAVTGTTNPHPHLRKTPTSAQLIVHGQPLLLLGAELQNSSLTSAEYMRSVWPKMVAMNINTVLGCVTWEDIEPVEGQFNFFNLDQVILDARAHNLHLILLWFGSWKNGKSTYCPAWVKKDFKRFPRAHARLAGGEMKTIETLSLFHGEGLKADCKAFETLMAHLKEIDEEHSTVIMVQVENEVGLLGDSRDGSAVADMKFNEPVPEDLVDFLIRDWDKLHPTLHINLGHFESLGKKSKGKSWKDTFGASKQTDELFMAYHYARYVNAVASAGKKAYLIPLYTNVWMNYADPDSNANAFPAIAGGGGNPGDYPSGGAVSNVLDIWQHFAPHLDFISPDIYLSDHPAVSAKYRHRNQPLFIPEQRRDEYGARRIWSAIGTYLAVGTSPFGIDTLDPSTNPYTKHYGLLASMAPVILAAQRKPGSSLGFFFDELSPSENGGGTSAAAVVAAGGSARSLPAKEKWIGRFGDFEVTIIRAFVFGRAGPGAGMIIHTGDARFLLIGWGFSAHFKCLKPGTTFTGFLRCEEKVPAADGSGALKTLRVLNGDETRSGAFFIMPNEDPDYGGFPIAVTIPARTGVAEVEIYALQEGEEGE